MNDAHRDGKPKSSILARYVAPAVLILLLIIMLAIFTITALSIAGLTPGM